MIEFCWRAVGKAQRQDYHDFFKHHHLGFDVEAGRAEFREAVNLILVRNGLAYTLNERGELERLLPRETGVPLHRRRFCAGDAELDGMLDAACSKFLAVCRTLGHRLNMDLSPVVLASG